MSNLKVKSSQLSIVRNDYNGKLTNAYSATPYRFAINASQLYGVLPLVPELETVHDGFVSYNKKEIVVSFNQFVEFILTNFNNQDTGVLFGTRLFKSANDVQSLLHMLNIIIDNYVGKFGKLNISDCRKRLSERTLANLKDRVEDNHVRNSLKTLWSAFLINIAMLNVKSAILSGDRATKDNKTVPIKFIPKLGPQLHILSLDESYDIVDFIQRYKAGRISSKLGNNSVFGSLINGNILSLPQYNLKPNVYIFEETTNRGYSAKRFENAIQGILKTLSNEYEITYFLEYMKEMESLIDACSMLSTMLDTLNESAKDLIVLDFNFHEAYDFQIATK